MSPCTSTQGNLFKDIGIHCHLPYRNGEQGRTSSPHTKTCYRNFSTNRIDLVEQVERRKKLGRNTQGYFDPFTDEGFRGLRAHQRWLLTATPRLMSRETDQGVLKHLRQ